MRRDRGHRAGHADERDVRRRAGRRPRAASMRRAHVVDGGRDLRRGRRVVVQVPLGHPHAADVHAVRPQRAVRRRGPARWTRRRCRPPAAAPTPRASTLAAPANDSAASSCAGDHLGVDAELGPHHGDELVAVRGVAGGARRDHPHPLDAVVGGSWRRTRPARPGCARAPRAPAGRCGRRPGRAGRSASRARRRSAAPSVDVGDEQPDRVRAAVDRGDTRRHGGARRTHGPAGPPVGQQRQRLVAERVDARARGQRVRRPARAGTSPGSASRRR